ncbi:S-adenosyl-L-methionine-dependent methyltransferase [Aspergillus novofumigatus IBT 16806]|uniref:S-adenosyl-L-methionine-dependent methyltransferase n=1 Tax=Aspergillus novofumigatus (strain IBT 16806) TaxID=1392255 RepID=A0A2I1BV91_ASPN1|nr:S-adenosyl-L-methionine-dependent methyltransferase [Aspergillus novofumigatus IBT 16806]PKX89313.1 S-adenosyl-L-methionine-dependent methyltransferase [Aspergillus novofumigatus IBT 16806]
MGATHDVASTENGHGRPKPPDNESMAPFMKMCTTMAEMNVIKLLVEYEVFDAIPDTGDISVDGLSKKCNLDPRLLERFTNFLVVIDVLSSPMSGRVAHTKSSVQYKSNSLTLPYFIHFFDTFLIPAIHWPQFFRSNGFTEPTQANRVPIGLAFGHPEKTSYEVLETMTHKSDMLNRAMAKATEGLPITGMYDFSWVGSAIQSKNLQHRTVIVDVGGGKGQALKAILKENPQVPPSQCVLMDREQVIVEAKQEDDVLLRPVKKVVGNFLCEQPIRGNFDPITPKLFLLTLTYIRLGALIYYIRRVLNDWPDDVCVEILRTIVSACAPDSRILISEQLLFHPLSELTALLDIALINIGGKRRSVGMFQALAIRAGLRVTGVFKDKISDTAVIEMMPAQGITTSS